MRSRAFETKHHGALQVSIMGFGGAPLGNMHRRLSEEEAEATVTAALEAGVTYVDTAPLYGHGLSEERIGRALARSGRGDVVLSTKIGRYLVPCEPGREDSGIFVDTPHTRVVFDYSYDGVMRSYEESLRRLGLESVDVLYIHDVDVWTHGTREASDRRIAEVMDGGYRALEELRAGGTVKAIGAGVNEWEICERLAGLGDFDCFLLAGRYTLLEQEALESFLPLCERRGIAIVIGGPFNSGILATGPVAGAKYNYVDAGPEILDRVTRIQRVCDAHGVPLARAAIQFPLAHPCVVSVIPGGQSPAEVRHTAGEIEATVPVQLWADLKSEALLRPDAPTPTAETPL